MIIPHKISLLLRDEDHGLFRAGESQSYRCQDSVTVLFLLQIEKILKMEMEIQMEDVYTVIENPPPSLNGAYSRFRDGMIF